MYWPMREKAYNHAMSISVRSLMGLVFLAAAWVSLTACASPYAERRSLSATSPVDRARMIVRVAERRDVKAVHKIVDLLDDRDPAVRMYAILALERLCGTNRGYHYYANDTARAAAVARWREALRRGEVEVLPADDDASAPSTASGRSSESGDG